MFGYEDELRYKIEKLEKENEKLRAVADVARAIVNNSGQAAFSPQLAVRMLKEKLEALDE